MPHTMVTFRLHRSGVILLAVFCLVLAVLIYVVGVLTARFWGVAAPAPVATAPSRPVAGTAGKAPALQKQPATPASRELLTLRVAVLTDEEDAKAEIARLTAMGLNPSVVQVPTSSGVTLHNIIVGQFETRSAANAAAEELQSRLGFLPVVIPAPRPPNL